TVLNAKGITDATPGGYVNHAVSHNFVGPDNVPVPQLPSADSQLQQNLKLVLQSHPSDGRVLADEPYTLYKGGSKVEDGITDACGHVAIKNHQPGTSKYTVRLRNGHEIDLPVPGQLSAQDDELAARGFRAAQAGAKDRLRQFRQGE
ncbi:type VI secretion system tip protein VgrG, partial [Variovorax humicola]